MSANEYQLAVIKAARALTAIDGTELPSFLALAEAVEALDLHEQIGSLDRLLAQLEYQPDVRALHMLRRQIRHSIRPPVALGLPGTFPARCWPAIKTAEDFAALDPGEIRDVRNAGPKTWGRWADALRAIGIEPGWAEALGV